MANTVELKVIKCSNKQCKKFLDTGKPHEITTRKSKGDVQCRVCGKRTEIK